MAFAIAIDLAFTIPNSFLVVETYPSGSAPAVPPERLYKDMHLLSKGFFI
jgi:hypothetical protein